MIAQTTWMAHNKWEFWSLVAILAFQLMVQAFQMFRQWLTEQELKARTSNAEAAAIEAARKSAVVDARQKIQGAAIEAKVSQDLNATKQVLEAVKQIVSGSKNGEGLS